MSKQESSSATAFNENKLFWAMRDLDISQASKNFFACGSCGTGKSLSIQLFLQSIAPRFVSGRPKPEQLVVFDARGAFLPTLSAMGLKSGDDNVWILNPFDDRSAVWDIAESLRTSANARRFAESICGKGDASSPNPYFHHAAMRLLESAVLGLSKQTGSSWSLGELLSVATDAESLRAVCATDANATQILNETSSFTGVLSLLNGYLKPLERVARMWHEKRTAQKFSIERFLSKPGALILGNAPEHAKSCWLLNRLIVDGLVQEILSKDDSSSPRHWFVWDEFCMMGKLVEIESLLRVGRGKGVSVLISAQNIDELRRCYGAEEAEAIVAQCANKSFFLPTDVPTSERAEAIFAGGKRAVFESWQNGEKASATRGDGFGDGTPTLPASSFREGGAKGTIVVVSETSDGPSIKTEIPVQQILAWRKTQ
jgi:hypothetical protein